MIVRRLFGKSFRVFRTGPGEWVFHVKRAIRSVHAFHVEHVYVDPVDSKERAFHVKRAVRAVKSFPVKQAGYHRNRRAVPRGPTEHSRWAFSA